MSQHEKISSFYDDELDPADRNHIVDLLKQNDQKQILGRYSMIGEAMRRNLPNKPDHDLFSRVQSALEDEPALLAPSPANMTKVVDNADAEKVIELPVKTTTHKASFKPVAGFAVAASVALASVLGFQLFSQPSVDALPGATNVNASSLVAISAPATQTLDISPDVGVFPENAAFPSAEVGELVSESEDITYAQQSLTDDGQWTRITRIGDILLDNQILSRPPEFRSNVDLKTGTFPFARASNLETVHPE